MLCQYNKYKSNHYLTYTNSYSIDNDFIKTIAIKY